MENLSISEMIADKAHILTIVGCRALLDEAGSERPGSARHDQAGTETSKKRRDPFGVGEHIQCTTGQGVKVDDRIGIVIAQGEILDHAAIRPCYGSAQLPAFTLIGRGRKPRDGIEENLPKQLGLAADPDALAEILHIGACGFIGQAQMIGRSPQVGMVDKGLQEPNTGIRQAVVAAQLPHHLQRAVIKFH